MALCKPCGGNGIVTMATRVVNGVPKCEACFRNQDAEPKKEIKMAEAELCFCGRPSGHRGIHRGAKLRKGKARTARKLSGGFNELLERLESERAELDAKIAKVKEVVGML